MDNIKKLAQNLVNYSCKVKKGEKVLIEANINAEPLINAIIEEIYVAGGLPFVSLSSSKILSEQLKGTTQMHLEHMAKYMSFIMADMNAYIGISAEDNIYELSNINDKTLSMFSLFYSKPVHRDIRVKHTKWVILKYPTCSLAQLSNKNSKEFEDFFYKVCNLNYSKMNAEMNNLKQLMEKTDRVKIVSLNTDLTFSIKGIPAIKCAGEMNIPDGEVFTAPIKDSVNGKINYNISSLYNGKRFDNICFEFKNGKIEKATSSNTLGLNSILDTDEGARYIGEFSFGLNPYITEPMYDILFDEKMAGSIHFTPGCCYDEADNSNKSAIHWDLILNHTEAYGGGEIWFDDVLIRKNGLFVVKELLGLNPNNLKQ